MIWLLRIMSALTAPRRWRLSRRWRSRPQLRRCRCLGSGQQWAKTALQKRMGRPSPQGQTCSPGRDRLSVQQRGEPDATPGVHWAYWWRGCHLAACGAGAAARPHAAYRFALDRQCGISCPLRGFLQALALLGWTIGRNVWIDARWATPSDAEISKHAAEWPRSRPT
jgi:hypothetical protein